MAAETGNMTPSSRQKPPSARIFTIGAGFNVLDLEGRLGLLRIEVTQCPLEQFGRICDHDLLALLLETGRIEVAERFCATDGWTEPAVAQKEESEIKSPRILHQPRSPSG
jgi:hypothetical protein